MSITISDNWTDTDDYQFSWAPTSDPRVLAVIQDQAREEGTGGAYIDGDAYAPAFYVERGRVETAGSTFTDDESLHIAQRYAVAHSYFVNWHYGRGRAQLDYETMTERFLRIFYGTEYATVSSSIHQGDDVLILSTPTWREHVGIGEFSPVHTTPAFLVSSVTGPGRDVIRDERIDAVDEDAARAAHLSAHDDEGRYITNVKRETLLDGDVREWQAALDGDVWGIGWAILEDRVLDDEPVNFEDFDVQIQTWDYLTREWATQAVHTELDAPELPELLELSA